MKDKILRLCKRLNLFSLNEIVTVTELDQEEVQYILDELIDEKQIKQDGNTYKYIKKTQLTRQNIKLPQIFQYHSNKEIDYIIKGFCSDIEVKKMINVFGIGKNVMDKFYSYFRTRLYDLQMTELKENFEQNPKIGQEREYMTAKVYLYLYNNKLYVSEKLLKSDKAKKHTEEERLTIKNIYLRSYRKVLSRSFAHKFHLHL
ncbi:hypothetical protein IJF81_06000, partial [bacterium]|nr:hypothetical protein [bacterium]